MYNEQLLKQDLDFVLRKFGLSKEEFEQIIKRPRREHTEFAVQKTIDERMPFAQSVLRFIRKKMSAESENENFQRSKHLSSHIIFHPTLRQPATGHFPGQHIFI